MSETTVPARRVALPVREVRVEVVDGAAAGTGASSIDRAVTVGSADGNTLVLPDRQVSRYHLEISRRGGRIRVADLGSTNGTRVGAVWLEGASALVESGAVVEVGSTRLRVSDGETHQGRATARTSVGPIHGCSDAMRRVMDDVEELAPRDVSVLLVGESGTGKELLARALHEMSARAKGAFVTLDCAATPGQLFTGALLGHERGAFTGANRRHVGAFERANGGTIFLDEVGELPIDQQAALLGVLERRRFERVGGETSVGVDVRVVAATNRDLRSEVNRGAFRLDLFYRLAVVTIDVPPLRQRPEDIPILIDRFLVEEGWPRAREDIFPREAVEALQEHHWPGNVRELRNVVAAAVATGRPPALDPRTQAPGEGPSDVDELLELPYGEAKRRLAQDFEQRYLARLLERAGGNVRQAARIAQMNRSYLIELLDKHGLR